MPQILDSLKKSLLKSNLFSQIYVYLHSIKTKLVSEKIVRQLQEVETFNEQEIYSLQNKKLKEILNYAYQNTDYYKLLFDQNSVNPNNLEDLSKIPFLNKKIIKNEINALISKKHNIKHLTKRNTGGSTGQPMEFYSDTRSGLLDNGHHSYLYSLMGRKKGDIILGCGGIEISAGLRNKNIFWKADKNGDAYGDYKFSVLYLTDQNIELYVKKILEIKPSILRGYPSFFAEIANYIIKNKIQINFDVKGANLTSEMCSNEQRNAIELAFSTLVYFEYGHNEISLYCYTKDITYIYQSSPIYGYIEVLNDDGSETEVGKIGNIVTTGFLNHGMPFIRYQTGDRGELAYRNGGTVHFKKIHGRTQDYIISKKNQKVYLTALIFGQHLSAFANITKWQIIQSTPGQIEIKIIKGDNYSIKDEKEIITKITQVSDLDINFNYVKNIPLTGRGKHLFLKQNIKKT